MVPTSITDPEPKSLMTPDERLYLYSWIRAKKPERVLEVGVWKGGSSRVIGLAMTANGCGKLVSVDPKPGTDLREVPQATLITGYSPECLSVAANAAGGQFNAVLVDGNHGCKAVVADIRGVVPFLADSAEILLHDAFNAEVALGIEIALRDEPGLSDMGMVVAKPNTAHVGELWGGFRLLRFQR